jgi:hypothetical protein
MRTRVRKEAVIVTPVWLGKESKCGERLKRRECISKVRKRE